MRQLTFHLSVAVMTFVIGTGFHQLLFSLADLTTRSDSIVLAEPISLSPDLAEAPEETCDYDNLVVISMADHRDLYLGKEFVGSPDDTREVELRLAKAFAKYERELMEAQPRDLERRIRLDWCYRMVFIKAANNSSYGDVVELVEAAKRAGAQHLGLVPDRRKQRGSFPK